MRQRQIEPLLRPTGPLRLNHSNSQRKIPIPDTETQQQTICGCTLALYTSSVGSLSI